MDFYQIYGSYKPVQSGGLFIVSPKRFTTRQEAEVEIAMLYAQETINIGSGVYIKECSVSDLSLWAQKLTEHQGIIWMKFT